MGPGQGEATDQSSELSQRDHALTLLHPARAPVSPQAKQAGRHSMHSVHAPSGRRSCLPGAPAATCGWWWSRCQHTQRAAEGKLGVAHVSRR
jgi:hypothetical protein